MKIVVLDGYAANPGDLSWEGLKTLGECTIYDRTAPEEVLERAAGAEAILTNKVVITAEQMAALPDLKYIGVLATGYNIIDINAARERGIVVTNIPAYICILWFSEIIQFHKYLTDAVQTNQCRGHIQTIGNWRLTQHRCKWNPDRARHGIRS